MIYSSLAVLAMSASALVGPFNNHVHLHPKASALDTRVSIVLVNKGVAFEDVKIGDHTYTVLPTHTLDIKAPAGTVVYADKNTLYHHRGEAILELKPDLNNKIVDLR